MAIPTELYPFRSNEFRVPSGARMHYLREGQGDPIVMLHGNPTWSFYYRDLVRALSGSYECIVPDHIGMGLSEKPPDSEYRYTLANRVADFDALMQDLNLKQNITLVLHDWGGMIGTAWAVKNRQSISRLVLLNTAAFPLPKGRAFHWQLRLARTTLGASLVRRFNAFSEIAARTCVTRRPMEPAVRRAYTAPYDSFDNRIATLRFVQDIPLGDRDEAWPVLTETADRIDTLRDVPTLICWGERDFVFDGAFLDEWRRRLPEAEVELFGDCGHYVLEDATSEVIARIQRFLGEHPI